MERLLLLEFGPLVYAAVLLVIITGIRRVVASFRSRPTSAQLKVAQEVYLGRLLNPQVNAVEHELGKMLPERLRQLYEDKTAIQSGGFTLENPNKKRWRPKRCPVYC